MSKIRSMFESPREAKEPHIIYYRDVQGGPLKTTQKFKDYQDAYFFGCGKWGSGSLIETELTNKALNGVGWCIKRCKE